MCGQRPLGAPSLVLAAVLVSCLCDATVVVYPGPGPSVAPSWRYRVSIRDASTAGSRQQPHLGDQSQEQGREQGQAQELFVYVLNNTARSQQAYAGPANRSVSWTSFATDGASPVRVTVQATKRFSACEIRPKNLGLQCYTNGKTDSPGHDKFTVAWFEVSAPLTYLSVELDGGDPVMHALNVFVDPLEDPASVPSPDDPQVLYFGPGVHRIGALAVNDTIDHVYAAPGAYIHGGFVTRSNHPVTVSGRGVFSGETFVFHDPRFPWSLIDLAAGNAHSVSGITVVDPPKYYFRTYANNLVVKNVKFAVAWTYNTDGMVGGKNSLIQDSYFRCNDDTLKIYSQGMICQRLTLWQNENGGVTQTGWWGNSTRKDILVEDIDLIHTEWGHHESQNNGIVDHAGGGTSDTVVNVDNVTVRDVRVDEGVLSTMSLHFGNATKGSYRNVRLERVRVDGWNKYNRILADPGAAVAVDGITFLDFELGGTCIDSAAKANFTIMPGVNVSFVCTHKAKAMNNGT
eukprot:m.44536 g.44536  ORF g.44536 m.44536 type:complete len:515 (+) comp11715_c0_seq1:200-1744(+)